MFNQTKYTKWYFSIMTNAANNSRSKRQGYYEKHHIIPKCNPFCGGNNKENLVLLTAKEHFIAHALLVRMTEGEYRHKMRCALMRFKHGNRKSYVNGRIYESNKIKLMRERSLRFAGTGNPFYGKKHKPETIEKYASFLSENYSGLNHPCYGTTHSTSTKEKIGASMKSLGKVTCTFCSKQTSPGNYKQFHGENCSSNPNIDPEILQKRKTANLIKSMKSAEKQQCQHCGKEAASGMIRRWHNDNCKFKSETTL